MRGSPCLFRSAEALHRVFVAPIQRSHFQFPTRVSPSNLSELRTRHQPKLLSTQQQRCYKKASEPAERRHPRDDEIKAWAVTVVTEDNKLSEPRNINDILDSIDRNTQSLIVVVPGEPGVPPICKIVDKKALREADKSRGKTKKTPATTVKRLELNWAVDAHDLGHRLKKMEQFLMKGYKVEVLMAAKRKGRKATMEEATGLVERLKEVVKDVSGARERKPMEGKLLGEATFFAEGTAVAK